MNNPEFLENLNHKIAKAVVLAGQGIDQLLQYSVIFGFLGGIALVLLVFAYRGQQYEKVRMYKTMVIVGFLLPHLLVLISNNILVEGISKMGGAGVLLRHDPILIQQTMGLAIGLLLLFVWFRHISPNIELIKARFVKRSFLERDRRTDIRTMQKNITAKALTFNPFKYFNLKRGVFIGLNEDRKPIYIDWATWLQSHILVTGMSRIGKNIVVQMLAGQVIQKGEVLIVISPKHDSWMPSVCYHLAAKYGVPYRYFDFNTAAPSQIDLFQGATAGENEEMLIGALGLSGRGGDSDYYKYDDRAEAKRVAEYIAETGSTAKEAFAELQLQKNESSGFFKAFEEIASLPAINAKGSPGLDQLVEGGGIIYIQGSLVVDKVRTALQMLVIRLYLLANGYNKTGPKKHICVFADEFYSLVSRTFIYGLRAAADAGLHFILAFQALTDLEDVPSNINSNVLAGTVYENCRIKLAYRVADIETARWLSSGTGTILVDDEVREVKANAGLSEQIQLDKRLLRQTERNLIDENTFLSLPDRCGVLFQGGVLPQICMTSPVIVEKNEEAVKTESYPESDNIIVQDDFGFPMEIEEEDDKA